MPDLDPYQVLGLPEGANRRQVREAFRRRSALAEEAKRDAPTPEARATIERQHLVLVRAFEMLDPGDADPASASPGAPGTDGGPAQPRSRPPALVGAVALGGLGILLFLAGAVSGVSAVFVAGMFSGAAALVSGLVWRHQLVEAWHAGHPAPPRRW